MESPTSTNPRLWFRTSNKSPVSGILISTCPPSESMSNSMVSAEHRTMTTCDPESSRRIRRPVSKSFLSTVQSLCVNLKAISSTSSTESNTSAFRVSGHTSIDSEVQQGNGIGSSIEFNSYGAVRQATSYALWIQSQITPHFGIYSNYETSINWLADSRLDVS